MIATTPQSVYIIGCVCRGIWGVSPLLHTAHTQTSMFLGVKEVERVGDDVTIVSAVKNYA